jgi:hypothetical protein
MPTLATRILEELDVERISVELQKRSKGAAGVIKNEGSAHSVQSQSQSQSQPTGSDNDNDNGNDAMADSRLSGSLISAAELESNSSASASASGSGVHLSPPEASPSDNIKNEGKAERVTGLESPAPSSSAGFFSEGQNTSSFLSNLDSTEPFTSSLPLSSEMASSRVGVDSQEPHQHSMESSMTSWVNFQPKSTPFTSQHADDEKAKASVVNDNDNVNVNVSANPPVIPDLELPTVDLAAVSVVDTQYSDAPKSQQSHSALSYTDDVPEGHGLGSLQRKSKAELWHELKIMC